MKIRDFLDAHRTAYRVYPHAAVHDAQHLAEALRVPGANVAKTVMLYVNHGYVGVVLVLPATGRVDFERVSALFGGALVRLASKQEVADSCPHCDYGNLSPFGSQLGMKTVVDHSLSNHEDLFFQGDTREEAIRMAYRDFYDLECPMVASICVPPQSVAAVDH